jgi:hypothetical protein
VIGDGELDRLEPSHVCHFSLLSSVPARVG